MKLDKLYASIEANRPGRDDVVYLERHGDEYDWWIVSPGGSDQTVRSNHPDPDAWMSFSAAWPADPDRLRAFFDDLLAELESMTARADRCRWPIDEPWTHPSHFH
jgi:hypothetical protein